jgi:hypothetical protein
VSVEQGQYYVTLADSSGALYTLPSLDLAGNPAPLSLSPQEAFDQVAIVGDTEKVADKRSSQIIPADQTGGSGRDRYTETEGVDDFRESDCDSRFAGAVVIRPERTSLGFLPTYAQGEMVVGAGYAGAQIHAWTRTGGGYYHPGTGTTWTAFVGPPLSISGYAGGLGYTYVAGTDRCYRSSNGINFAAIGGGAVLAGALVAGLVIHDNKLWTVALDTANNKLVLYACVDPTNAVPAAATFARVVDTPWTATQEQPIDLVSWKDGTNAPLLLILTTRRMLAYDAVGGTIVQYDDWIENNPEGGPLGPVQITGICAAHFKTTGDLYVGQGQHCDYLMRYSPGAGFEKVTPNGYGGLTKVRQGAIRAVAQNAYGLGVWTAPTTVVGEALSTTAGGGGGAWFINEKGGWHCLNRRLGTGGVQLSIIGGGIGNRKFWTVFFDGTVEEQALPPVGSRPQFAVGRRYDTQLNFLGWHHSAITDGGSTLLRKTLYGFTLHCLLSDGTGAFGMDTGAAVYLEYRINGGNWTAVSQYKDGNGVTQAVAGTAGRFAFVAGLAPFPLRLLVNPPWGVQFYELEWRYRLETTDATKTPVIVFVGPRYRKKPSPRYTYEFVTDLAGGAMLGGLGPGGPLALPGGNSAQKLHEILVAKDASAELVQLRYGAMGEETTVESCEFAMAPQHLPHLGIGRYRIVLRDVTTDPSG